MSVLSGKRALAAIDESLHRARKSLTDVERQYAQAREGLARLRHGEIGVYAALAKLRLLAIESGALLDALGDADRTVAQTLEQRSKAAAVLEEAIEAANTRLGQVETRRAEQQEAVAQADAALDSAEAAAQAALAEDPAWLAQLEAADRADFVADQAEEKAAAAQRDRIEKGRPYEEDPLFSYLFSRGYGTSRYAGWPLTRWLDGSVARLCDYEAARRQYALLVEIPERLREHAAQMRAAFETEAERLLALETAAAEAADVPGASAELARQEESLARIDAEIAAQEDKLRDLVRERVQFANGNDPYYQRCIEMLSNAMRRDGFALLQERAARTREPEDDALVSRLVDLEREAGRVEQDLADFRRVYERESRRLQEFEDVRRRFKSERYDDPRSEFLDAALFTLVLERILNGAIDSREAWKAIARQQRMRAARAGPRPGRVPRSWRGPPGGGFGGGGFRSGGGFGSGGFKTGGGF